MSREKLLMIARYFVGLVCLFAAAMWMADVRVALAVVASFVAGYVNQFYVIRSMIALARGSSIRMPTLLLATFGIAMSIAIVGFGFGLVLLLATGTYFVVDALILRFR